MRYLVEGKVIPERIDLNLSRMAFGFTTVDNKAVSASIEIIESKLFIHVDAPKEVSTADIRNILFSAVGNIVNFAGFRHVIGVSYELDSITEIDEKWTMIFGAEGFVFDDAKDFGDRITFKAEQFGVPTALNNPEALFHPGLSRATFELRNSIRYPDFTALHCRLAIEAIRNSFDAEDETRGWQLLRDTLNIDRATIESFKDVATKQRHGKNEPQSWEQRRRCMQIAWEICSRFVIFLSTKSRLPITDFPLL
jgi:hypothetical protein